MPEIWETRPPVSGAISQGSSDDAGKTQYQSAVDSESAGDVAFAGPIADFILYGVVNGAFAQGPPDSTQNIEPVNNPLPYWSGPTQVSGGAITAQWVADSSSPSGYNLRFNIAAGAAGDEAYFEQVVPIGGDRGRRFGTALRAAFYRVLASGGAPRGTMSLQYLKADGTTTGSASTAFLTLSADATLYQESNATTVASPPADAIFEQIRIGVRRNTMAATDTATIDVPNIRVDRGGAVVIIGEQSTPGTYAPGIIYQTGGDLHIEAALATHGSGTLAIYAEGGGIWYGGAAAITISSDAGVYLEPGAEGVLINEMAAPATPSSGYYAIYPKTDGKLYGKNDAGTEVALGGGSSTVIRPSISADQNNWNPTGLADNCVILVDLNSANRTITGLTALSDGGHVELMAQSSTNTITLSHLSGSSTAANQFRLPGGVNYVVGNKAGVRLVYDATDQKWRVVGPA